MDLIQDGFVADIADLIVLVDDQALLIANTTLTQRHHCIAGIVGSANVAIDTLPAVSAFAFVFFPR